MFCTLHSSLLVVIEKLLGCRGQMLSSTFAFCCVGFWGWGAIGYNLLVYEVSFPTLPNCHCT